MAEFREVLQGRRSIRKFEDRPVPPESLQRVLEAVMWSPSWANSQCWEVIRVTDPERRERLQQTMGKGNPATKAIVSAPELLALCGRLKAAGYYKGQVTTKFGDWFMFDLGIACQSLCLAAWDQGLGTVIVGLFDQDRANEVLELPEDYECVVLIPLGYPAQSPKPPKRRPVEEFTHKDKFGGK